LKPNNYCASQNQQGNGKFHFHGYAVYRITKKLDKKILQ